MFNKIKQIILKGDPNPVALFIFFTSIWFALILIKEPDIYRVLPQLFSSNVEDYIAYICLVFSGLGIHGIERLDRKIVFVSLLALMFIFVFTGLVFLLERHNTGSTYLIVAIGCAWAIFRGAGDESNHRQ